MMMKINIINLIVYLDKMNEIKILYDQELGFIRGGAEPIKPSTRPRDEYDDEKAQSYSLSTASQKDEAFDWVEWLKNWLGKN